MHVYCQLKKKQYEDYSTMYIKLRSSALVYQAKLPSLACRKVSAPNIR